MERLRYLHISVGILFLVVFVATGHCLASNT
jgi:hypothetical protein